MVLGNKSSILADIWNDICSFSFNASPLPSHLTSIADQPDDGDEELHEITILPSRGSSTIGGYHCILDYQNARGTRGHRRITCRTLEQGGGIEYLKAFCHERSAPRKFRCDRIMEVIDVATGEIYQTQQFLGQFRYDDVRSTPMEWGLNLHQRADFIGCLNALVFVARCDGHWHPLEEEVIEHFATSFWLRREIEADLPLDKILERVRRLRPDPEAFFIGMARCENDAPLARLLRRHIREVIDADGFHHQTELFWGEKVDRFFDAQA